MPTAVERENSNTTPATGPVTPIVVIGLLLAVMLAAWCIHLAFSYNALRGNLGRNVSTLVAVDSARGSINALAAAAEDGEFGRRYPALLEQLDADRKFLEASLTDSQDPVVIDAVGDLEVQLLELATVAGGLREETEGNLQAFQDAQRLAMTEADHVVRIVRTRQREFSEALAENWRSLYVALLVSAFLAVVLGTALVFRMAHSERRHRRDMARVEESQRRFELLAENVPGVIYLCRNDERYTMLVLNEAVEKLTGYSRKEFLEDRISFMDLFHPEDRMRIPLLVDDAITKKVPFELHYRLKRKDGQWRWVEEYGQGVFDGERLVYLEGFIADVTERTLAEQELRRQRSYLRQVLDLNPSYIFAKDRGGKFTLANQALAHAYGTTVEDLVGKTDADFNAQPEEVEHFRQDDLQVLNTRQPMTIPEEVVTDSEGHRHWFKTFKRPIIDEHNQANEVLGVAIDITDLKQSEIIRAGRNQVLEAMATGKSLTSVLQLVAEMVRDLDTTVSCAVILNDPRTGRLEIAAMTGFDVGEQRAMRKIFQDTQMQGCREAMECGHRIAMEDLATVEPAPECVNGLRAAGFQCAWIEPIESESGDVLGTIAVFGRSPGLPDGSHVEMMESSARLAGIAIRRERAEQELRESQERLRAADRMASIGTLTAGLGHDMNNVLFPLRCRLEAVDWSAQAGEDDSILISVRETVNYLQQLADGLRLMSSDPASKPVSDAVTNIDEWWPQVRTLIQGAMPKMIRLEHNVPRGLPLVRVQPHQLTQAVLNLAVNAAEATEDRSPVTITLRAAESDSKVVLTVTDRGCGMSEEVKSRVLEPFFTTKSRGLSTGLGLSLVHGVVQSAGGSIDIESSPGTGTTVTLMLPARSSRTSGEGTCQQAMVSVHDARASGWIKSLLSSSGYSVRQALDAPPPAGALWVTEPTEANLAMARHHRARSPEAAIIVFGDASEAWSEIGASAIDAESDLSDIQNVVRRAQECAGGQSHED